MIMVSRYTEGPGGTQATHSAGGGDFGELSDDLGGETRGAGVPSELGMDALTGARARLQKGAGRALEASTEYLRTHDVEEMRSDLERSIRAHPIKSLAIALGTGWMLGKIFR
jgi:hypothetical protein